MLRRGLIGLVVAVTVSACGAEVAVESSAATLPPLRLPAVVPTVPTPPGPVTAGLPDPTTVDLPEKLDIGSFDIFGRLDVDQYEVTYRVRGDGADQDAVYMYQRDPPAGRIVGTADGDEIDVVVIGAAVWARFGPTPNDALVEASDSLAVLAAGFFKPGAVAEQNLDPLDFNLADFTLNGPGEFEGRSAYEYAAPAPRQFSWWVDAAGVVVGGGGVVGTGSGSSQVSFVYRWEGVLNPIEIPTNIMTEEEFLGFLNGQDVADPTQLHVELRRVQAALEGARQTDGTYSDAGLDVLVSQGLIDGWQPGISNLPPGVIGVVIESDSVLLAAGMPDGRHYCIALEGDVVSYGASFSLIDLTVPDGCAVPDEFPDLEPPA